MSESPSFDTVAPEFDQEASAGVQAPPRTFVGTLKQLGPGLIIAGSIVGSGELIATTKTGAQAGISLLWLIVFGCVIKVFVQVELGKHAITHGQTTLNSLNQMPGRIGPMNFILWFFLIMMAASTFQQGGIVGGVGQSLAIAFPIRGDYRAAVELPEQREIAWFLQWEEDLAGGQQAWEALPAERRTRVEHGMTRIRGQLDALGERGTAAVETVRSGDAVRQRELFSPWTWDDRLWASVATLLTVIVLYNGRYGPLQTLSTVLVVLFTFITLGNVIALQSTEQWRISGADLLRGFSFTLPSDDRWKSIGTALAAFGIIGVGATELIVYPYWCLEKGYARFTGKRTDDPSWASRAQGWMRVMRWDAFLSMVVYTSATVAFFIMGAAVLYREGRDPDGMRMVSSLAAAYVPVFGEYAKWLFLLGAIAVLYSTFLIANAGHARLYTDLAKILSLIDRDSQKVHNRLTSLLCVILPLISLGLFWTGLNPVTAVLTAGFSQAIMLPMLGIAAIYFRRTGGDPRLRSSRAWDLMLVLSVLALVIVAVWSFYSNLQKARQELFPAQSAMQQVNPDAGQVLFTTEEAPRTA